ncbi:MAG: hypothetical protein ACK55I_03265, partial [bacterium]
TVLHLKRAIHRGLTSNAHRLHDALSRLFTHPESLNRAIHLILAFRPRARARHKHASRTVGDLVEDTNAFVQMIPEKIIARMRERGVLEVRDAQPLDDLLPLCEQQEFERALG